jgi:glucosamine 6-phosphate synthetase-like amidotransferase/phosphosugar isomerase protein
MRESLDFNKKIMKKINWETYYDEKEFSDIIEKGIMEQAEILRKNLKEKRSKNKFVKEVEYV